MQLRTLSSNWLLVHIHSWFCCQPHNYSSCWPLQLTVHIHSWFCCKPHILISGCRKSTILDVVVLDLNAIVTSAILLWWMSQHFRITPHGSPSVRVCPQKARKRERGGVLMSPFYGVWRNWQKGTGHVDLLYCCHVCAYHIQRFTGAYSMQGITSTQHAGEPPHMRFLLHEISPARCVEVSACSITNAVREWENVRTQWLCPLIIKC